VRGVAGDPLALAKLNVFKLVAATMSPFMKKFQTEEPVLPFLGEEFFKMVETLLITFNVLRPQQTKLTLQALMSLNMKEELAPYRSVRCGFEAERLLKKSVRDKKISEKDEIQFRKDTQNFVVTTVEHLLAKSPTRLKMVRLMCCFNPHWVTKNPTQSSKNLTLLLSLLVEKKIVASHDCDAILLEYSKWISLATSFAPGSRLDAFFAKTMAGAFPKLFGVAKIVGTLSHGQAQVESGFSVNKKVEVENLQEDHYPAFRRVYDYVHAKGGNVAQLEISSEMRRHVSASRERYRCQLAQEQCRATEKTKSEKRRALQDEIAELEKKRARLQVSHADLVKSADQLSKDAEDAQDFTLLSKANAFRTTAAKQQAEATDLSKQVLLLQSQLE
jgi:hypothetical protein